MWINLKTSRLAKLYQACFLLAYLALACLLFAQPSIYFKFLVLALLAQAIWAWRLTWGSLAPYKLLLSANNKITAYLNNQHQEDWQPPALIFNRWVIVFSRPGWFNWPWLVSPGSLTKQEHQELRRFLRSWHE